MMKSSTLFVVGAPPPPTSTSRPPDVIHVTSVPRPSPFFSRLPPPRISKPKNKKRGRPGNEARRLHALITVLVCYNILNRDL